MERRSSVNPLHPILSHSSSSPPPPPPEAHAKAKAIEWEDFEQELARLVSLSSALDDAKRKKAVLQQKLESVIQVRTESLSRLNELEEMREKVQSKKMLMQKTTSHVKATSENAKRKEESLSAEVSSLLVAGTALSVSRKRLQESGRLFTGSRGYGKHRNVQKMLRVRQQYMVSQVSMLYSVKNPVGHAKEQELESFPSTSSTGNFRVSKPIHHGSLTILGVQLTMVPFTKVSFFTDKKELQQSATALGYVGHSVTLIASYLKVPLRYPLRLGGSHSYIMDLAPSIETPTSESSYGATISSDLKPAEFPLFLEGQDTTRAAYAVFLLNKDLEQLLNFAGVQSLGPRHILANLKELLRTILSADYVDRFMKPLISRVPIMVMQGSHEIEEQAENQTFVAYSSRFEFTSEESGSLSTLYYSFNTGRQQDSKDFILKTVINSGAADQYEWLVNDLSRVNREVHAYERSNLVYNYSLDPCGPVHITVGTLFHGYMGALHRKHHLRLGFSN